MKTEYIVQVQVNGAWYLESICGNNKDLAEQVYKEKQEKNPNKQYRVESTDPKENWWNTIGTH